MINLLKKLMNNENIDGYIIPKNDEFFSEYSFPNRLKFISNFSGSAGMAIILKDKNFYDMNNMKNINFAKNVTENEIKKENFIYSFLSSIRQKMHNRKE